MLTTAFTANGMPVAESQFQTHALDIAQNVVIEACAGSGKTWLLTARLLRLLLAGTAPQAILAITFTRKATQEMKQRLAEMLNVLCEANPAIDGNEGNEGNDGARAGTLAALGLVDTPELRAQLAHCWQQAFMAGEWPTIATFHEWFASVRKAAPFSLQNAPAAVLTEDEFNFTQRAWQAFWKTSQQDAVLAAHMKTAIAHLGLNAFESALKAVFERRAEWQIYVENGGDSLTVAQAHAAFEAFIQVKPAAQIATDCLAAVQAVRAFPKLYWVASGKMAKARADKILAALTLLDDVQANPGFDPASAAFAAVVTRLAQALSNANFALPSTSNIVYKAMEPALGSYPSGKDGFITDFIQAHAELNAARTAFETLHLLPAHHGVLYCANVLIAAYQNAKLAHGVVDFTDLELEALHILQATQGLHAARDLPWTRTQHVLLDEFQDTNPIQWQALQAFLAPILAESSSGGQAASVFVVGDPKQSIYRFRRADPALFGHVAEWLHAQFGAVVLRTQRTRRNAVGINALVNGVFVHPELADVIFAEQFTLSATLGEVRALPLVAKAGALSGDENEPFNINDEMAEGDDGAPLRTNLLTQALDAQFGAASAFAGEAEQIASQLVAWKHRNPHLPWAHVMVLARRRAPLQAVAAALHAAGVPCVSDEKGGFFLNPEVADVLALLAALHNPLDALATMQTLRSPIFGINNAQLSQLAAHWQVAKIQGTPAWCGVGSLDADWARHALAWLKQWQWLARHLPTHDALDAMLKQGQLQEKFSAAAPAQRAVWIAANMQQLLRTALDVDGGRYPSLAKFIAHVQTLSASNTLAAEPLAAPDAVRISTIHSAKGLEADLVILMDTSSKPKADSPIHALLDWPATQKRPSYFGVALGQTWAGDSAQQAAARSQAARDLEQHTVLYVALTRAKNAFWISGTASSKKITTYTPVSAAIGALAPALGAPATASPAPPAAAQASTSAAPSPNLAAPPNQSAVLLNGSAAGSVSPSLLSHAPQHAVPVPPYLEPHDTQRGKALHAALQAFMQYGALPSASVLLVRSTLPLSQIQAVLEDAAHMVQALQLDQLRTHPHVKRLALEQAWLAPQKATPVAADYALLRPDVVVYGDDFCWLIDYKTHFKPSHAAASAYALQLQSYLSLLPAHTCAYLLNCEGECWQRVPQSAGSEALWQAVPAPWVSSQR